MKHVLFPSDLSGASQAAIQQLKELARAFQAKVTLFHATEAIGATIGPARWAGGR